MKKKAPKSKLPSNGAGAKAKASAKNSGRNGKGADAASASAASSTSRSTIGGPARPPSESAEDDLARRVEAAQTLAAGMPHNAQKAGEHGEAAYHPAAGSIIEPAEPSATASTITETTSSTKLGDGEVSLGDNPTTTSLDRVRVDSANQPLTTNQGTPIADNQNSLKSGLRGPALLEDFILREKITHFDHERIPERIVHARGSGAHGFFECYEALTDVTRASLFAEAGKITPVFVRFSTVIGERGSADTVRDVRGFAVKFYSDEGNWDLVGNNIPVFFIQDAMKFPDLVHAAKPEPHFQMPQAATAHDTFWDFVSLMPESAHMLMWAMSDRAIPRSYRTMQGFGVHTFRLVNHEGESRFVKFHWNPVAGTHSLDWDEAVKISGADPDFHRRDLWESIEAGAFPEYELGMQIFTEEQADAFSFDVLDATKIVPEELVPVRPVGRMVLNRNPDNFFAETEQVAFCAAHIVPGLDFTNDPLLAGRIHSYVDTQISRLGGPNFHEIPINAPVAPVHNNQRDGVHRQAIHRGRVSYEPNSLAGGVPFQAGAAGFTSFPEPIRGDKIRGKPEKFADHYRQATLFWDSQSPIEKLHIVRAYRFELTKVQTRAVRQRMLALLANVANDLAAAVAEGLGMDVPEPLPVVFQPTQDVEVTVSPALSLLSRPGDGSIAGRRVAILIADGVDADSIIDLHAELLERGAVPRLVGSRLGSVATSADDRIEVEVTMETTPAVLYDALVLPDGKEAVKVLGTDGHAVDFIKDQYRHCKPILALGAATDLAENAGAAAVLPSGGRDPGMLLETEGYSQDVLERFVEAIAQHRHFARQTDPPMV